jgi:hypothetical protein
MVLKHHKIEVTIEMLLQEAILCIDVHWTRIRTPLLQKRQSNLDQELELSTSAVSCAKYIDFIITKTSKVVQWAT